MILFVPSGYRHLHDHGTKKGRQRNEKIMQLLHILTEQLSRGMFRKKNLPGLRLFPRSVPLSSKLLMDWIGKDYASVVRDATEAGFIEVYGMRNKGKCMRYRYGPEIDVTRGLQASEVQDRSNERRIENRMEEVSGEISWVRESDEEDSLSMIDFDIESAMREVEQNAKTEEQRLSALLTIERFRVGAFNTTSDSHGRVHNALTSCKKVFRNMMTVDDERIACVDIGCSQFVLLGVLAKLWQANGQDASRLIGTANITDVADWNPGRKSVKTTITTTRNPTTHKPKQPQQTPHPTNTPHTLPNPPAPQQGDPPLYLARFQIGLPESVEPLPELPELLPDFPGDEMAEFRDICSTKDLYAEIARGFLSRREIADRSSLKVKIFEQVLFGRRPQDVSERTTRKIVKAFASRFPTLHAMIQDFRKAGGKHRSGWHTYLPETLQRIESQIVHGVALPTFRARHGGFVTAIHDCLVVRASQVEEARQCLVDAFETVGWTCRLKIETEWASDWRESTPSPPAKKPVRIPSTYDDNNPDRLIEFAEEAMRESLQICGDETEMKSAGIRQICADAHLAKTSPFRGGDRSVSLVVQS